MLRGYGAEGQAKALEACAAEVEAALLAWLDEPLTLEAAVHETGYSYSSLQKRVANEEVPNAGDRGSPRVRRRHLPYKARVAPVEGIAAEALLRRL